MRPLLKDTNSHASAFSKLEVLGFNRLDTKSKLFFESAFYSLSVLPISDDILHEAILLRQQRKLSTGDAIIAATALAYDLDLYTRNVTDFSWIPSIRLVNPILP